MSIAGVDSGFFTHNDLGDKMSIGSGLFTHNDLGDKMSIAGFLRIMTSETRCR